MWQNEYFNDTNLVSCKVSRLCNKKNLFVGLEWDYNVNVIPIFREPDNSILKIRKSQFYIPTQKMVQKILLEKYGIEVLVDFDPNIKQWKNNIESAFVYNSKEIALDEGLFLALNKINF